ERIERLEKLKKRRALPAVENKKQTNSKVEIQQLKTELSSLKSKLSQSNPNQKTQLENKLTEIESQIKNLSSQDNSPSQSIIKKLEQEIKEIRKKLKKKKKDKNNDDKEENNNNNNENNNDDNPEEDDDLSNFISSIFRRSKSDKSDYQLFSNKGQGFKVYIAKDHPLIKGKKLDNSDDTPPFSIRFKKKNASRQEGDK
ncbi:13224_t:CDS:2, partial [Ambispora leptoticha]